MATEPLSDRYADLPPMGPPPVSDVLIKSDYWLPPPHMIQPPLRRPFIAQEKQRNHLLATLDDAERELRELRGSFATSQQAYERQLTDSIRSGEDRPTPPNRQEYERRRDELRKVIERANEELKAWALRFQKMIQEHAAKAISEARQAIWKAEAKIPELERALAEARAEVRHRDLAMKWVETTTGHNGLIGGWEFGRAAEDAEKAAEGDPSFAKLNRAMTGAAGPEVALADERGITGTDPDDIPSEEQIARQVHYRR